MNWEKVDATLAGALADAAGEDEGERRRRLPVFVLLGDDAPGPEALVGYGLRAGAEAGATCTAELSAAELERLTAQPWVRRVQLSASRRLLGQ